MGKTMSPLLALLSFKHSCGIYKMHLDSDIWNYTLMMDKTTRMGKDA